MWPSVALLGLFACGSSDVDSVAQDDIVGGVVAPIESVPTAK